MTDNREDTALNGLPNLIEEPAAPSDSAIKSIDPPGARFSGSGGASARMGANAPRAVESGDPPFTPRELDFINAFLALKGYSTAYPTQDPRDEGQLALVSESHDPSAPAIVIGHGGDAFWFVLIDSETDDEGPVSTGFDGIESLPLLLAMIEHPDAF